MSDQGQKLIDKIESEEAEKAKQSIQEIDLHALQRVQSIVEDAKQNVVHLLQKAQSEGGVNRAILMQSTTDMLSYLRNEMNGVVRKFVLDQIDEASAIDIFTQVFETIIMYALNTKYINPDIHIVLNKNDFEKLEDEIFVKLQNPLKQHIKLQFSNTTGRGFMVNLDNQKLSFDFTKVNLEEYLKKSLSEDWQI